MSLLLNCTEVAFKFLSSVEIDKYGSNQHELHGARAFKEIFGSQRTYLSGTITYIASPPNQVSACNTNLTWYNAREFANNNRTEFRFYYTHEISVFRPQIDDILLVSKDSNQNVVIVIINDINIKNTILSNINLFTAYKYANGSSYYANISSVPFLISLI